MSQANIIYLTFDMDWASDELLDHFYDLICQLKIRGTLNVTHNTGRLMQYRGEDRLELGIHPNFNKLLNTEEVHKDIQAIIHDILMVVPEAVTARSHSLVTSTYICKALSENGIKYESNIFYQPSEGIKIKPYKDIYNMIRVPIIFEDDLYLSYTHRMPLDWYLSDAFYAPRVFNFHPIHLFLNTENMNRYHEAIIYLNDFKVLKKYQNRHSYGIYDMFIELIQKAKQKGYVFKMIKEIAENEGSDIR